MSLYDYRGDATSPNTIVSSAIVLASCGDVSCGTGEPGGDASRLRVSMSMSGLLDLVERMHGNCV